MSLLSNITQIQNALTDIQTRNKTVRDYDTDTIIQHYRLVSASTIGHLQTKGYLEGIRPQTTTSRLVGKVLTVKIFPPESQSIKDALIASQAGDVLVIECSGNQEYACWGELRNLAGQVKGLSGVIVDGKVTDIGTIREQNLPVFANGVSALTTRKNNEPSKNGNIHSPITVAGVQINSGDIAIGDEDGVFILSPHVAADLLPHALHKETKDQLRRQELQEKLTLRLR